MKKNLLVSVLGALIGSMVVSLFSVSTSKTVIQHHNYNSLYKHLNNRISVLCSNCSSEKLKVITDNGKIIEDSENYILIPAVTGKANLYVLCSQDTVHHEVYKVKETPDLSFRLDNSGHCENLLDYGIKPTEIDLRKLRKSNGFVLDFGASEFNYYDIGVHSFEMVFLDKESVVSLPSDKDKFSQEQQRFISSLSSGDKFSIESIQVKMPDGLRFIQSVSIKIR